MNPEKCAFCGKRIGDSAAAYVLADKPSCEKCYKGAHQGRTRSNAMAFAVIAAVLAITIITALLATNKAERSRSAGAREKFDSESLDVQSLVGVECIYTDSYGTELPVLASGEKLKLPRMSRVVVQQVFHELSEDYDHPRSLGYKFHVTSPLAPGKTVVLYPDGVMIDKNNGRTDWYALQLCPVSQYDRAVSLWKGKTFAYKGTKIGDVEVLDGTVVSITDVVPLQYGTFSLSCRLPNGTQASLGMGLDYWDYSLRPIAGGQ